MDDVSDIRQMECTLSSDNIPQPVSMSQDESIPKQDWLTTFIEQEQEQDHLHLTYSPPAKKRRHI